MTTGALRARRLFLGDKAQAASALALGGQCKTLIVGVYWFCANYVRRLSGCLLSLARPVEASAPPSEKVR